MQVKKVRLRSCFLNIGELHRITDPGFFHPVFHCVTDQGDEFAATMRLHLTEPLDKLVIVDPRAFDDGGYAANSAGSQILRRRTGYGDKNPIESPVLNPALLGDKPLYEISDNEIKRAVLNGYDFKLECERAKAVSDGPLKIAFTCHDPQIIGGGNLILFRYVNWLAELGVKASVYSCGRPPTWTRVNARFHSFHTYAEMFSAIQEDIIVLYSMWHIESMLRTNPRGRRIYHLRQCYEAFHHGVDYESLAAGKPVIELLESLPLGIIAVSPHVQQWYKNKHNLESLLITNAVDIRSFYPPVRRKPESKLKKIVSVGNIKHFAKGTGVLANALMLVAKTNPGSDFEWTVASGQKERCDFNRVLAENLQLIYRSGLSQSQMRELYQNSDVMVNPSLYEGFGLPTLEAMACGVPVVQADNHGLDCIVQDNHNCLVVPVNNPAKTAEAIQRILSDKQLQNRLKTKGIETAQRYSIANQFDMFVSAFEEILQTPFPAVKVDEIRKKLNIGPADEFPAKILLPGEGASGTRRPLVSVVIPAYNQAAFLREALDSLLVQTYPHWEAVVVNDGSTDNTAEVLSEYAETDPRIRPVTKPNGGITSALNEGLKHCRGDYFSWLSSDDLYYPEKLEVMINAFENLDDDYALVYGSFDTLQEETHKIEIQPFAQPIMPGAEFPEPLKFDFIDGCSMMIRMDVMREVDGFNPHYRHSQDTELWMRIASRGYRFHLVNRKVAIRRVHVEQSSTSNMIHCRYDAAWMVNYYLEHFHLLEMYRYFDLTRGDHIDRFVEHFVGRMLHTEAAVNHPLIQQKFWKWFDAGLTALPTNIQTKILKKCLNLLLVNSPATYKMRYYTEECLVSLSKKREHVPFAPNFSVEGRNIRYDNRERDDFAEALFDYGTDLLVNEHTPLFAQELYFHNTNKVVDTPFKLAHSVFRYLSQFSNPYRKIVEPYAAISQIPVTQKDAVRLFILLRYPEHSEAFEKSLEFDAAQERTLDGVTEHETLICRMPQEYKDDLRKVCGKNPTATILNYWNALILAAEGRYAEALAEGWKTFTLGRRSCDWRIAYRLGAWAEKAGDSEKAAIAYAAGHGCNPSFLPFTEGLNRVLQGTSLFSHYVPAPKESAFAQDNGDVPGVILREFKISPQFDGSYIFELDAVSETKKTFNIRGKLPYSRSFRDATLTDPYTNKSLRVSASSIFDLWSGGYSFIRESLKSYKKLISNSNKVSVAFTILNSSILGGGPLNVYRYANWLSALGVDVAVYSNDAPPAWSNIKVRFYHIPNDAERYRSIAEPIVIVYSILELPNLLRHCNTEGKRIFHFCQGVEEFHYHGGTFESLTADKPVFEILHSLPVGRLAVSPHLRDYFHTQYGQRTHTILNGIDPNTYVPRWKRPMNNRVNVLIVGNPEHLSKGSADVKEALSLLAGKHAEWKLHLTVVSGQKVVPSYNPDSSILRFAQSLHCGLNPQELRQMYHAADVYVNPAWYEGFGLPALEAMACGVPVVQADNRGLDGIAVDGQNCLMVPPQNPQKMAEAIETLIRDHGLRVRLIENGLETASRFSLENQYEMFVTEFENILNCKFDGELVKATKEELECGTLTDRLKKTSSRFQPLISVLVPTYNQAKYLPAALDSLIAQTYLNWEAIVVNDGSADETPLVMERYAARDRRIRLFHKENGGVASALNEGLRNARGEWICWLSSDDLFEPDKLASHTWAMEERPQTKFFHTHYYYLDEKTGAKAKVRPDLKKQIPSEEFQVLGFFCRNYVHGNSVAIHHSVFDRVGNFDERLRCGQDFDMWLRISALYPSCFINRRTCVTRWHSEQTTRGCPEDGFFDSGRACVEFLNSHKFSECFPFMNLTTRDDILKAVNAAVTVSVQPDAMLYKCGYHGALLERLGEWLKTECPDSLEPAVKSYLVCLIDRVMNPSLPEEIRSALLALRQGSEGICRFAPHDFANEAAGHVNKLLSAGETKRAESLKRYLSPDGSGEEEACRRSNLKYWQQLQDNGYFEKHRDYRGLKEYGDDYKIINKYLRLSKEMNVVVVGCGYGREVLLIAPHVKHVYGIDVNRTILDKADKFLVERGITNFTSVLAEQWKDIIPGNIDLVYEIIVFQHLTRDLVKDYIRGLSGKLSPNGRFLCQFAELHRSTQDAELRPYEPNVRWTKAEIEGLIEECGLTKDSIDTQDAYGEGYWHWAFFGKQETGFSPTRILFYFDRIGNSDSSPAGTVIAVLNFAKAVSRCRPGVAIHLTGDLVRHPEQFESFQAVPLPSPDKREEFLADYDAVFFATHVRYFKGVTKPAGQIWVLYQHCWEADDPVSLAHMNDFDAVICLSELHRAFLCGQGIPPDKLLTIPNLIDTDIYLPGEVSRNNRSIMFAGGLHPHKCIHILLDAFRLVRRQLPEAELHIYGDGAMWRGGDDYGNWLKRAKPEGVYFHGYVDNADMPEVYSKHGVLCLPSRLESFGLVTVEAQACGCVPVVHSVGGVGATLVDGRTGLLYSPNTPEKLAETIVRAMTVVDSDPSIRRKAIDFARDNFSITKAAKYVSTMWDRLNVARQVNKVKALFESNDIEKALAECDRLLQRYPEQPDLLLLQALIMLHRGDTQKCKSMLMGLVEKYGRHQMALNNLGVLSMNEGSTNEALEYLVKAYHVNPYDKNTTLNCSAAWRMCGRYKQARMILYSYLIKLGEDAQVSQLLEKVNDLIAKDASDASLLSEPPKSMGANETTGRLMVIPHYRPGASDPLVSVIMPVYNCQEYIGEAIESVLTQSYPKFELIIVDDGSTDNTKEEILRYSDDRVKYTYQENGGPSRARNHAIKQAGGQYIMPLDADDMMAPDSIISHLKEFEKCPAADLVYSDVLLIDGHGNPIKIMNKPQYRHRGHLIRDLFRYGHPVVPFRLGIRRSVFDSIGLYDEGLIIAEDYDMMRRFVKAGLKEHHLPQALHLRRMQPESLSTALMNTDKAGNHFDVMLRFLDTFPCDELFPDIDWSKIPGDMRQLCAKSLVGATFFEIGRRYLQSKQPVMSRLAFEKARLELGEYLTADPANTRVRQLFRKCELLLAECAQESPAACLSAS